MKRTTREKIFFSFKGVYFPIFYAHIRLPSRKNMANVIFLAINHINTYGRELPFIKAGADDADYAPVQHQDDQMIVALREFLNQHLKKNVVTTYREDEV